MTALGITRKALKVLIAAATEVKWNFWLKL
jgi:hypothetical protein